MKKPDRLLRALSKKTPAQLMKSAASRRNTPERTAARMLLAMDARKWDESKCKRDGNGQFATTGGGGGSSGGSGKAVEESSQEAQPDGERASEDPDPPGGLQSAPRSGKIKLDLQLFAKKPSAKPVTDKEMAMLEHGLYADLTRDQWKQAIEQGVLNYEYGGHSYILTINEDRSFEVLSKVGLDESSKYYDDQIYARWKNGEPARSVGASRKKAQ